MEFKAQSPADVEDFTAIGRRLTDAIARYNQNGLTVDSLTKAAEKLRAEERATVERLQSLPMTETRAVALDLAAVRAELGEVERRLESAAPQHEAILNEVVVAALEMGNAIYPLCAGFFDQVREAFIAATSPFFNSVAKPRQLAGDTDTHRACLSFVAGVNRSLRASPELGDEVLTEAQRRLTLFEAILGGKPLFEWPPVNAAPPSITPRRQNPRHATAAA